MFSHQRIVVANHATSLRVVLVVIKLLQCEVGQLSLVLFDVENV